MASDNVKVAALGRPFTLGMLYDARTDQLIPGVTLWNNETLQKNEVKNSQHSSEFEMSASDTVESKSNLLNIKASLKASFLGGLVEVGGSAKYLNDTKKSKNQCRLTCQYKATTDFKQLSMSDLLTLDSEQTSIIENSVATHVVTGILYGANAFFVFDSEKVKSSSVQDIEGSMEAVIKKIPSFNVEGKVEIKLTEEEEALTKKFSCKFYGDFILESNPATFVNAVKTYVDLPKLLGENGENGVPLTVWMMPLKNLHSEAAEMTNEISVGLTKKVQDALEDLKEIGMRCNDCLSDSVVKSFPQIQKKLLTFQKLCNYYASNIQQTMAEILPSARNGEEVERSAEQVLFSDSGDSSPFSHEKLSRWLDHKEREINVVRSCLEIMEGTKVVQSQSEMDREVLAPGVHEALIFVFTSLDTPDPCLHDMDNHLEGLKAGSTSDDPWYYSDDVFIKMRKRAKDFHKFTLKGSGGCFLVAAIANEKHKGASVYRYRNGILVNEDFYIQDHLNVETLTDIKDLIDYAYDVTLDPDTAHDSISLTPENKMATLRGSHGYEDSPQRFDSVSQVLCREGLTGRCYWELDWGPVASMESSAGVCYSGLQRKGDGDESRLGKNAMSWCLGYQHNFLSGDSVVYVEHDNKSQDLGQPVINKLGVFLDWSGGSLSFYSVSDAALTHLHTFYTTFSGPLYPAIGLNTLFSYMKL
ncbi:neoverrucotoxin subunit beta-like [Pempheris klunzingeri]|uniref:neoverrucotoxin subunit beta-like n=1 Tax=Pempheris klunzingeri TaxID=3127111 RepID=UPI00397F85E3